MEESVELSKSLPSTTTTDGVNLVNQDLQQQEENKGLDFENEMEINQDEMETQVMEESFEPVQESVSVDSNSLTTTPSMPQVEETNMDSSNCDPGVTSIHNGDCREGQGQNQDELELETHQVETAKSLDGEKELPEGKFDIAEQFLIPKVEIIENHEFQDFQQYMTYGAENQKQADQIVYFINKDNRLSPSPILQYVLEIDQPFDTVICCGDGKLGAHRLVLAAASAFLSKLFEDHRLGEIATLLLPDIRVSIMKYILNLCYTGKMVYKKDEEDDIYNTMRTLLIGEFAKLTMKEVKLKVPLKSMSSDSNLSRERERDQQQEPQASRPHSSRSRNASSTSGSHSRPSSRTERRVVVKEMMSASSSPEDEDDDVISISSSDSDYGENRDPTGDKSRKRNKSGMMNKTIKNDTRPAPILTTVDSNSNTKDSPPYDYVVHPLPAGSKELKLQCARCPCAFKSLETLSEHLDNHHAIVIDEQLRDVNDVELQALLKCDCDRCTTSHNEIASANKCLSKRSKTRCFVCFESIRLKQFEKHMKLHATIATKQGFHIVKCTWCSAGIIFQTPFDHKTMSNHCSMHFKGVCYDKKGKKSDVGSTGSSRSLDFKTPIKNTSAAKIQLKTSGSKRSNASNDVGSTNLFTPVRTTRTTPLKSTTTVSGPQSSKTHGKIPTVLAMLQKASQKRKSSKSSDSTDALQLQTIKEEVDTSIKRIKLETGPSGRSTANTKEINTSTSTDTTMQPVNFKKLSKVVPHFISKSVGSGYSRGKIKTIWLDVTKVPKISIKMGYDAAFVSDCLQGKKFHFDGGKTEAKPTNMNQEVEQDLMNNKLVEPDQLCGDEIDNRIDGESVFSDSAANTETMRQEIESHGRNGDTTTQGDAGDQSHELEEFQPEQEEESHTNNDQQEEMEVRQNICNDEESMEEEGKKTLHEKSDTHVQSSCKVDDSDSSSSSDDEC